jgi:spermidine/putrescine ABC transporter ATP-binding subunit
MSERKSIITIEHVSKRYGAMAAVDNVSLEIKEGEFFALLGPSGCGKTTLLRMIAGFEVPTEGRVLIDGQDMANIPPNQRPVNMVFQSYAVFPHMCVADNVGYGLRVDGVPRAEIDARVEEALNLVQLPNLGARMPDQMSGGQRQRVALARALIKKPKVLLLDEPLSALDAKLREHMQLELVSLQQKVGVTFIIVTHDQAEALSMADRIAVMNRGVITQLAAPSDLYEYPANKFVADFIGSVNLIEGVLHVDKTDEATVTNADLGYPIYVDHGVTGAEGATVYVAIRPEKIALHKITERPIAPESPEAHNIAEGQICAIAYLGSHSIYEVVLRSGRKVRVSRANQARWEEVEFGWDEPVWLSWHPQSPVVLQG